LKFFSLNLTLKMTKMGRSTTKTSPTTKIDRVDPMIHTGRTGLATHTCRGGQTA